MRVRTLRRWAVATLALTLLAACVPQQTPSPSAPAPSPSATAAVPSGEVIDVSLVPKLELDSMASAMRLVKSGGWATVMPPSAVQRSIDDKLLVVGQNVRANQLDDLHQARLLQKQVGNALAALHEIVADVVVVPLGKAAQVFAVTVDPAY